MCVCVCVFNVYVCFIINTNQSVLLIIIIINIINYI